MSQYKEVHEGSLKRETRIDSSDSARPAATINSETAAFAQGLKAKKRIPVSTENVVGEDGVTRRVKTMDDGVLVTTKLFAKDFPNAKRPAPKGVPAELWDADKGELKAVTLVEPEAEAKPEAEPKPTRAPSKPKASKG